MLPRVLGRADLQRVARAVVVKLPVVGWMGRIQQRMSRIEAGPPGGGVTRAERDRGANQMAARQQRAKAVAQRKASASSSARSRDSQVAS
jgi:hypothetical protein